MSSRPLLPALAGLLALAAVSAVAESGQGLAGRALELLASDAGATGPLALTATLFLEDDGASRPDLVPATLELRLSGGAREAGNLDLGIALTAFETEPQLVELALELPAGTATETIVRVRLEVPEEIDRLAVAVGRAGALWGAVEADLAEGTRPEGTAAVEHDLRPATAAVTPPPALRLLPPLAEPVVGPTRIRVLLSDPGVARVVFELDGETVAEDRAPPFEAQIDFGPSAAARELRALAYDAAGRPLGSDRLAVNRASGAGRVRIGPLEQTAAALAVTVEIEPPAAAAVTRLELYLNEERMATLTSPPWRVELPVAAAGQSDFVRAVATFSDGTELEDARLLTAVAERVEVNLVQLFAVVTDRDGVPRTGLAAGDFEVRLGGRRQAIDRFAPASEVPLVLGLVIDTSASMWTLMPDTRRAGASFLAQTLRSGDRAFLVDFDTRPRLAAELTEDVGALLRRFAGLTADGFTALYDAVIFSMLQFEQTGGRKALVVLTDGDDYKSRFGARRSIEYGRELGVPVYIIAFSGMFGERRDLRKLDLESLAGATGGRVFYIDGTDQLGPAYERIEQELRSQYLLAFSTPEPLSPDELASIRVSVRGRGLEVRAVAGAVAP